MSTETYKLSEDLHWLFQQPTMERPKYGYCENRSLYVEKRKEYIEHLASLKKYPAEGFTTDHLGKELKEGVDFEIREEFFDDDSQPTIAKKRSFASPLQPCAPRVDEEPEPIGQSVAAKKFERTIGVFNAGQEYEYRLPLEAKPGLFEIPKPMGDFILKHKSVKAVFLPDGAYYHYKDVVILLNDYAGQVQTDKERGEETSNLNLVRSALQELVYLKSIKGVAEYEEQYENRKPLAWAKAKIALSKTLSRQSKPALPAEEQDKLAVEFADWLLDVNLNGVANDPSLKIILYGGNYYWESDDDGDYPLDAKRLYELFKQHYQLIKK
jgi:hypothetical protein